MITLLSESSVQNARSQSPISADNLLTNGSFELGLGAEPFYPGWRIEKAAFPDNPTPDLPLLDTTIFHGGTQSLKLSRPRGRGISLLDFQSPDLPAGTKSYVSFWARSSRKDVKVTVGVCPPDGKSRTLVSAITGALGTEWQQYHFEVPDYDGPVPLRIEASSDKADAFEFWIDDIVWSLDKDTGKGRSGPVEIVLLPESRNGIRFADSPVVLTWSADSDVARPIKLAVVLTDLGRREEVVIHDFEQTTVETSPTRGKLDLGSLKRGAYLAEVRATDPLTGKVLGVARERFTVMTDLRKIPAPEGFDVGYHGGIEFGSEMGFNWRGYWSLDEFFATNFLTGFRVQRDIWDWDKIQPLPDQFSWGEIDRRVDAAFRNGCTSIVCIPHSPLYLARDKYRELLDHPEMDKGRWIYKSAKDISEYSVRSAVMGASKDPAERKVLLAPDRDALTKLMTGVAERYKDKIAAIEFINEANLFITAKGLIEFYFKPAYAEIKKVAPDLPVLMNQTMDYSADGNGYNGQFLNQGGFDYSDGIMHHPYGAALLQDNGLVLAKTLERLAQKYSRPGKPMVLGMSEIHGIGDYSFLRGEAVQRALIDWSIGCRWSAGVLLPYHNFYEGTGPRKWLLRGPFAPGLGAVQMNALYSTLGGFRFKERIELDDLVLIGTFERSKDQSFLPRYAVAVTAAHFPATKASLEVDLTGIDVKAFDPFGEPMPLLSRKQITLSSDTIYLQSSDPELLERLRAGRISWSQTLIDDVEEVKGPEAYKFIYTTGMPPLRHQMIGLIQQWSVLNGVLESSDDASPEKLGILDSEGRLAWPKQKIRLAKDSLPYVLLAGKPPRAGQAYYAYSALFASEAQEVTMHLSSTGPTSLWINGKVGPSLPDLAFGLVGASWQKVKIPLKAGLNSLLIRVVSNGNPSAFALSANEAAIHAEQVPIDEDGFLREWKIIGPWKNPRNEQGDFQGNTTIFPPEKETNFHGYYTGLDSMPLVWHEESFASAKIPHQWINAISYGATTVEVTQDTPCLASLGSDDGYALWINGELIGRRSISRAVKPDDEKIPVTLKKGVNQILFKIEDTGGGGGFVLRFLQQDGRPIALKSIDPN